MAPILQIAADIHFEIIKYLDPVDSTCYGLASREIYSVHRKVHGSVHMWHRWRSGTFYYGERDLFDRLKSWMEDAGYVWAPLSSAKGKAGKNETAKGWVKKDRLSPQKLAKAESTHQWVPKRKVKRQGPRLQEQSQNQDGTWKGNAGSNNIFWTEYVPPQHPSKDQDIDSE